jgi:hypothetical protein
VTEKKGKKKRKITLRKRITGALWGALLGVLTGTALSSALARVIKADWLKAIVVDGFNVGIPEFSSSLGFFSIKLGFSFRFTFLSGIFMIAAVLLFLLLPFREDG